MSVTKEQMQALVGQTLTDPRGAAQSLMGAGVPREALWPLLGVVVLISTLLSGGLNVLSPAEGPMADLLSRPFVSALMTFAGLVMMIYGLHWTGRALGGEGHLSEMVLTTAWLQFMLFLGQIVILLVALVLPPLGALLFLGYLGFSIWMAVAFVDAVHRFDNYIKSFGVILVALVAIGVGLSVILTLAGVSAIGVPSNV